MQIATDAGTDDASGDARRVHEGGRSPHHDATPADSPVDAGAPDTAKTCSRTVCSSGGWCRSDPTPNPGAPLFVTGPDDVWASSGGNDGAILHWDGCTWTMTNIAPLLTRVWGIWASGGNDVYAVTVEEATVDAGDVLFSNVMHWDGKAWSISKALPEGTWASLVWGSGPNDVWVPTGAEGDVNSGVLHFDGTSWTTVALSGKYGASAIWGSGPDDVWLTAWNGPGFTQHWDGKTWTSFDALSGGASIGAVVDVWGSGPGDVWAVQNTGQPIHWDGTAWTRMPAVDKTSRLNVVWGSGPNDVWAAGVGPTVHWDGTAWSTKGPVAPRGRPVRSIDGSSSVDVWLAGGPEGADHFDGTSWTSVNNDPFYGEGSGGVWGSGPDDVWAGAMDSFRHWTGASWTVVPAGIQGGVGAIWGSGASDVWAVGGIGNAVSASNEQLLHFDGKAWALTGVLVVGSPRLWGSGPDDVWEVTWNAPALHWDGKSWTTVTSSPPTGTVAIWGSASDDVWIGTNSSSSVGSLAHYDGTSWATAYTLPKGTITALWGSGPKDVWATAQAATKGALYHFDGKSWTPHADVPRILGGMWGTGPKDLWFTGYPFAHWNGASFEDVPTCGFYSGLWGSSGGVWAIGDGIAFHP